MSISYPSIIIGGLTSNTGSFSGSFYGNLSGSGLTTQITSSLISGSEGYFEELYINGVPVGTGGGISAISSSDNLTGSGLGSDPVKLLPNISLTSVTASVSGAAAQFNTLNVLGTLTANELHITYETSSVLYTSGSTKFGDSLDDTHQFTGSLFVSGNITANNITASYFSGTFVGDGSGLTNIPSVDLSIYVTTSSYSSSINILTASISSSFLQSAVLNDYVTTSSFTSSINDLTASISSSFLQLDDLTASNISNFQQDVRAQFSAGTNITINNGVISASVSGGGISFVYTTGSITGSGLIGEEIRLKDTVIINTLTASFISASSIAVDNSLIAFNTIDADVLQVNQESSLTGTTGISGTISLLGYATYNGVELNTAGGTTLASLYASNGVALISGTLGVTINASGVLGAAPINMSASAVNISAPVIANSFTGDGSGLYNLPPAGLSHIQIPLAYNQTTTNTVDTLVGGGKINGTYYITKAGTFEVLGYVANSGSDTLEVELYNISDSISEAVLSISSSITTAVSAPISSSFGAMPKIYEVYIRNSTSTGNITLLSANMLID